MATQPEEIKLLALCALADNRQAFGQLVEMYQLGIRRFLTNLTVGDVPLAEDLAQETFIKAYRNIRGFNCLSNFSTWLYKIAYNEFISYQRRNHEVILETLPDVRDQENSTEYLVTSVMEEVDKLDEPYHSIILLHYIEDKSIKHIAKILDLPQGTVKVYLMRARNRLKTKFQK